MLLAVYRVHVDHARSVWRAIVNPYYWGGAGAEGSTYEENVA